MQNTNNISIQGHRGARGLYPENTIPAFIEAVKCGVNAIEMDVVVSNDLKIVVSHEPWMNDVFCTQNNGIAVPKDSKENHNLYKMTYAEIKKYDCGLRKNPDFPLQKTMPAYKPLLTEVINEVENYTKKNNLAPIVYNIEIKSEIPEYNVFQPEPAEFVKLVYAEIQQHNILNRIILQSFDVKILQEIKKQNIPATIGLLIENTADAKTNLERLGFVPHMYNPEFPLVTKELIHYLHQQNIQIIPWTVNEVNDMKRLISMGVDGIITDYPNQAMNLMKLQ